MDFFMHRAQQLNLQMRDDDTDCSLFQLTVCEMLIHAISILYKRHPMRIDDNPKWLSTLLKQLHSPDMMSCTAEEVYRMSGYSPPVVIKKFKQYTGQTIQSYLVKLKIDWAIIPFTDNRQKLFWKYLKSLVTQVSVTSANCLELRREKLLGNLGFLITRDLLMKNDSYKRRLLYLKHNLQEE
jgi:AraC-like DNA-binding protein